MDPPAPFQFEVRYRPGEYLALLREHIHTTIMPTNRRWWNLLFVNLMLGTFALAGLEVKPLSFAAHPNDLIKAMAADAPKGWFPRGFSGEQPYWTIVGLDGGREQGLIGEDGAIEIAKGGVSVEPFVQVDGRWIGWADVVSTQSLQDGYLPIPTVAWHLMQH